MRRWQVLILLALIVGSAIGLYFYQAIFSPNIQIKEGISGIIRIKSGSDLPELKQSLIESSYLQDASSFDLVARMMKFSKPKPGQYLLQNEWDNRTLISTLRAGKQIPVNLTFNNIRSVDALIGLFAKELEPDSLAIADYLYQEDFLIKQGYSKDNLLSLFIPNSYQFYWNSSPKKIAERFIAEHKRFYSKERIKKLEKLGLTIQELYILASIVQKETLVQSEKPTVAGVYLNRLKRGQLLQADPTVVFANGDFGLRRVLNKHLEIDSPYNTYKYAGLPPGPICMPDVSTIDAVLNYEKHKYIYFCASPDNSGRHVFAKSLIEHNRNANRYRAYLNEAKIYR